MFLANSEIQWKSGRLFTNYFYRLFAGDPFLHLAYDFCCCYCCTFNKYCFTKSKSDRFLPLIQEKIASSHFGRLFMTLCEYIINLKYNSGM